MAITILSRRRAALISLLFLLTILTGCISYDGRKTISSDLIPEREECSTTQTTVPPPTETSSADTSPPETMVPTIQTDPTAPTAEVPPTEPEGALSLWQMSVPQQSPPIIPQPGDTTATWEPDKGSMFPADGDCTDAMLLEKYLTVEGLTWTDLSSRGCRQLVLVVGFGENGARITCYHREAQGWVAEADLTRMVGWTGKKGITHDRRRNTLTSPAGLWALGEAFGNAQRPEGLHLPWRAVTENSDWVCDDQSVYFNTWQERSDPTLTAAWDYSDVEHLADYPKSYAYACIIRYNTPPYTIPERGCAIFFHCANGPTEGCIGLPEADFLRTLLWLEPEASPYMLIATDG